MKRALIVTVVAVLMLAPLWVLEPSRPEPDCERRIASVMDDDAEEW